MPSCKLLVARFADSLVAKPSVVTLMPAANRSTSFPFSLHDTDETGGLALISHCRSSSASSSTETSSDPESCGGSEGGHHTGRIEAAEFVDTKLKQTIFV